MRANEKEKERGRRNYWLGTSKRQTKDREENGYRRENIKAARRKGEREIITGVKETLRVRDV